MNEQQGRVIAFDVGEVRVGVALCDPLGITVRSLEYITGAGKKEILGKMAKIIEAWSPRLIIVGLPLNMDGSQGPMAEKAQKYVRSLEGRVKIPVKTVDERLTTKESENLLISADVRRKDRKKVIDGMAANLILQKFLERERSEISRQNGNSSENT